MNKWWGYLHVNGTLHVKRYFDSEDIHEASLSPFVDKIGGPWIVSNREEAIEKLKEDLAYAYM